MAEIKDRRERTRVGRMLVHLEKTGKIQDWGAFSYLRPNVKSCLFCDDTFYPGETNKMNQKCCSRECSTKYRGSLSRRGKS